MDGLRRLLHLIRAVTVVQYSPPAMADALVSAGLLPALAALLGRWEVLRAAAPAADANASRQHWTFYMIELVGIIMGLGLRYPKFCRQVRLGGGREAKGGVDRPLGGSLTLGFAK